MSAISSFKIIENKHDVYRGKNCMKTFCEPLKEHAMKIINFIKKKMNEVINKRTASYENAKKCHICEENLTINILKMKIIKKLETMVIIQGNIEVPYIPYVI